MGAMFVLKCLEPHGKMDLEKILRTIVNKISTTLLLFSVLQALKENKQ
jgi:hypothetical protein